MGGMAEVHEAVLRDVDAKGDQRRLAVKVLLPDSRDDPEIVDMFLDEATIASRLEHPNIVGIHGFGEAEGTYYLAMEYVDGWTLRKVMQHLGTVPVGEAVQIIRELCRALGYIHSADQGIIHRDVTPQNIFLTRDGGVKLGDFGIAKARARRTQTVDGTIKGKLAYLAPEQITGEPVTPRTDLYAAGLILFELLTGKPLIKGDRDIDVIRCALNPPSIPPSTLRPEAAALDRVIKRALERHPVMRYPDAATLGADLDQALGSEGRPDLGLLATQMQSGNGSASEAASGKAGEISTGRTVALRPDDGGHELAADENRAASKARRRLTPLIAVLAGGGLVAGLLLWSATERRGIEPQLPTINLSAVADAAGPRVTARPPNPADGGRRARKRAPSRTRAPRKPRQGSTEPTVEDGRKRLASLIADARSRGLFTGDDAAHDRLVSQARSQLDDKQHSSAIKTIEALEGRLQGFRIDRSFADRKLKRLGQAVRQAKLVQSCR